MAKYFVCFSAGCSFYLVPEDMAALSHEKLASAGTSSDGCRVLAHDKGTQQMSAPVGRIHNMYL
jgi:hypothetical protein